MKLPKYTNFVKEYQEIAMHTTYTPMMSTTNTLCKGQKPTKLVYMIRPHNIHTWLIKYKLDMHTVNKFYMKPCNKE